MAIGIGGAGSKLAAKLDSKAILVNVSETELNKVPGGAERILATVRAEHGQFRGSRKNPEIGKDAYLSNRRELRDKIKGQMIFCSSGGGTGNGITSGILKDISELNNVEIAEKTFFAFVLPYARLESSEFVDNTIAFLTGPVSAAIDSGNTGNMVLFSNRRKFEEKISEDAYNTMLIESLKTFLAIPDKNDLYKLLDGHIDHEDFTLFLSKPYFNHFTYFDYDEGKPFGEQLANAANPFLLPPEAAIEAMFLVEVPKGGDPTMFYPILEYFNSIHVSPVYSVVENPDLVKPFVTVAVLYSRKPEELVEDFKHTSEEHIQAKVKKTIEQSNVLQPLRVNLEDETKRAYQQQGGNAAEEDILATLRRLGKL
ncbi:MAG: hypothetical protein IJJ33_13550 [Victivallales bacterium]|nr:hypothetical protein [Victivallales bacterium]